MIFLCQNVKEQMEVMQDKDTLVTRRNTNHQRLLEHLGHLVVGIYNTVHCNTMQYNTVQYNTMQQGGGDSSVVRVPDS